MPVVTVNLRERAYPIVVEPGALARVGPLVAEHVRPFNALLISSPVIARHHGDTVLHSLRAAGVPTELALVPPGDRTKSLAMAGRLLDAAIAHRLERSSAIIALGGGVVGDLAGFVAAILLRGVSFVQVPTTLLAQVDASVGGKTAVNHRAGKNLIGCFHQPRLVVIDPVVLDTLPPREFRSGLAEMIKHGVVLDSEYFALLEREMPAILRHEREPVTEAIAGSCELKAAIVAADERESGHRALLNYGHTFGHALEAVTQYRRYKHGEAVAIGMEMAAELAQDLGVFSAVDARRQTRLLLDAGLPTRVRGRAAFTADDLLGAMEHDKKVARGKLRFVLPVRIGQGEVFGDVPTAAVRSVCERLLQAGPIVG